MGDFHEYYSGKRTAPYLTIFVGGNHEASSHLQELHYGGWVAPRIYYMGAANVIRIGDLRIAGLSGIWKGYHYNKPHHERLPYTADEVKSLYHVRESDVRKLLLLKSQVDIGISHDWPRGIEWKGDHRALFRRKDHLESDAKAGMLGNVAANYVMQRLRPPHWFAAHLHCKYAAIETYGTDAPPELQSSVDDGQQISHTHNNKNEDEIELDLDEDVPKIGGEASTPIVANQAEIDLGSDAEDLQANARTTVNGGPHQESTKLEQSLVPASLRSQLPAAFSKPSTSALQRNASIHHPPPPDIKNKETKFLALDKCLPSRDFLQLMEINPHDSSTASSDLSTMSYDPEWLAILRVFSSCDPHLPFPPDEGEQVHGSNIQAEETWISENLTQKNSLVIPNNFQLTAPIHIEGEESRVGDEQPIEYSNPQTKTFCELINIPNWFDDNEDVREARRRAKTAQIEAEIQNPASRGVQFAHGRGRGGGRGGRGRGGRRARGGRFH